MRPVVLSHIIEFMILWESYDEKSHLGPVSYFWVFWVNFELAIPMNDVPIMPATYKYI